MHAIQTIIPSLEEVTDKLEDHIEDATDSWTSTVNEKVDRVATKVNHATGGKVDIHKHVDTNSHD